MATAQNYVYQELNQDSSYWFEKLLYLWPWELLEFTSTLDDNNDPVLNEHHFWMGKIRYYLEHAYFNKFIHDDTRAMCFDLAENGVKVVRAMLAQHHDVLLSFENAYNSVIERGKTFGYPTVVFDMLDHELNEIMEQRIIKEKIDKAEKITSTLSK